MGAWYTIGLFAGLGAALAVLLVGLLGTLRAAPVVAFAAAAGALVAAALLTQTWKEALAGAVGAACGAFGARGIVAGTLRRGGTRGGTAAIVAAVAVVLAALAFVPVLGYLEALALPLLALRMRARSGGRYEGLRILAKD